MNDRVTLEQCHLAPQGGQYKGVLAEAGGGIKHLQRSAGFLHTHGARHQLASATTVLAPVAHLATDKFRPDWPGRTFTGLL